MKKDLTYIVFFLHEVPITFIWLLMLTGYLIPICFPIPVLLMIIGILFCTIVVFQYYQTKKTIVIRNILIYTLLICNGMFLRSNEHKNIGNITDPNNSIFSTFLFTVDDYPTEKQNSYMLPCHYYSQKQEANSGKILVYFPKEKEISLHPGDQFFAQCRLQTISIPATTFAFNYKAFLARRNIHFSAYIKKYTLVNSTNHKLTHVQRSRIIREKLRKKLDQSILIPEFKSLIMAVTLGDKVDLSLEVKSTFQRSGTMHVLCVSGFHVGIVAVLLFHLFLPLLYIPKLGNYLHPLLVILGLFGFAIISGLTASVLRAVCMCTLYLIAKSINRTTNSYQILFSAGLILFCFSPNIVLEVGFQLSFSAVIGILYFYPKFKSLIECKNPIIRYFYEISCVSFAAQLGTMPLVIYYFHTFPVYGILSNLIAIPLVFVVVILSFLFFTVALIGLPTGFISIALSFVLEILIRGLRFIGKLPLSTIDNLNHSIIILVLLLFSIIYAIQFLRKHNKKFLLRTVHLLLLMAICSIVLSTERESIIFARCKTGHCVLIPQNDKLLVITEEEIKPLELNYIISPVLQRYSITEVEQINLEENTFIEKENIFLSRGVIITPEFIITATKEKTRKKAIWKYIHLKNNNSFKKHKNKAQDSSSEWITIGSNNDCVIKSNWKNRRKL